MKEVTIVCDQCLKFAHTEVVGDVDGLTDMVLVECHGVARMASLFNMRTGRDTQIRLLWSQVTAWLGPEDSKVQIKFHEDEIERHRRAISFWKRLK